ncbi:unnamed protein product [Schistosoma margrebowiei]|uniref:Uncharacterized protein n=1 Tax=Schistosoma margrebowiei TaxID=48269 RepID=A0A183N546_9TREM|nr:unnamed protein product [Schistosoma margrebowiei]
MPRYPPDRWFDYTSLGVPVKGTRLLPIKLPIPSEKSSNIPFHLRFDICKLLFAKGNFPRYLPPQFLRDNNISYHKIYVEGHTIPNSKTVEQQVLIKFRIDCFRFINMVNKEREQSPEFEWARGHPVERENYVEDLLNSVSKLEVTNVENNRSA